MNQNTDAIRDRLIASDVLRHYGIDMPKEFPRNRKIKSPFNVGDKTPSFDIKENEKVFFDYSTGLNGDWLTFIALYEDLDIRIDFPKVLEIASNITGVAIEGGEYKVKEKKTEQEKQWEQFKKAAQEGNKRYRAAKLYKTMKGIDLLSTEMQKIEWGVMETNTQTFVILPLKDHLGRVIGFQKSNKRMVLNSRQGLCYDEKRFDKKKPLYVVEGMSDYLAMNQMGYTNVLGVISSVVSPEMVLAKIKDHQNVISLFDADTDINERGIPEGSCAGARITYALKNALGTKMEAVFISVHKKRDVCDVLNSGGRKELDKIIEDPRNSYKLKVLQGFVTPPEKLSESVICDSYLQYHNVAFLEKQWWMVDDGVWKRVTKQELLFSLQKFIEEFLHIDHTAVKLKNALYYIENGSSESARCLKEALEGEAREKNLLFLQNGKYNLDLNSVSDIEASDYCFSTLNVAVTERQYQKPEKFLKFLGEVFMNDEDKEDRIKFIQEWFGYCLYPDNHIHKFLYLVGGGGNGKGTMFHCLQSVLGLKNFKGLSVRELENSDFSRKELLGAYANVIDDAEKRTDLSMQIVRTMTGGDPITSNVKNKDYIVFRNFCKLIIASNYDPLIKEPDNWINRRLYVMPMTRQFSAKEMNPNLRSELEKEKNEIFWWAVEGLKRILDKNKFTEPASVIEATKSAIKMNDYYGTFIEDVLPKTMKGFVELDIGSAYQEFKSFCLNDLNMRHIPSRMSFQKKMDIDQRVALKNGVIEPLQDVELNF